MTTNQLYCDSDFWSLKGQYNKKKSSINENVKDGCVMT